MVDTEVKKNEYLQNQIKELKQEIFNEPIKKDKHETIEHENKDLLSIHANKINNSIGSLLDSIKQEFEKDEINKKEVLSIIEKKEIALSENLLSFDQNYLQNTKKILILGHIIVELKKELKIQKK